jgi:photosystem II stability/assembly factor-like uncharacterized protein
MLKKLIHSLNLVGSPIHSSSSYKTTDYKVNPRGNSKRKIGFILSLLFLSSSTFPQWVRTNGPEGTAIRSLVNIGGTIYAGTEVNGVYISTDDGVSWIARNTGIETFNVPAIINLQGYVFAGTFGNGVYRSSDGGQTWIPPSNATNLAVKSLATDDIYIFAGTVSNGVYRSSDNGTTWEQKISAFLGYNAMCKSGNKVIVSSSNYTLYTTDHGETWDYITQLDGAEIYSYYCNGDTIFAGGRNKIYKSINNGNTFTTINLNFNSGIVNIYSITSHGSNLYAATSEEGIYKSTDNGLNWFAANIGMGPKDARAITVTNSSTLIAGTHYVGVYRSTDLGLSWNKSVTGFPAGSNILTLFVNEQRVFAGTRDGIYRSDDDGENWVKLTGTNDTINYSTVRGICEKDGDIYVAMFLQFNTTVYKTTDKGLNWTRSGTGLPSDLTFIFSMVVSGNNILAATDEGVYYSPDNGTNWYLANAPIQYIPNIAAGGDNFVYAAVPGIGIYKSGDDGVNWIPSLLSPTVDYVEVAAINNYAFAGTFFGGACYSSNYGGTWFLSNGFPSDASVFVLCPVADEMVLAGTDLSPNWIYASFNNGVNFSPYSEGLANHASVEAFAVNETYMLAGTDQHGVWRRLLPGVPVELISFNAKINNSNVELEWQTATETNNSGFEIQRKGAAWERIGFVEGHGTISETQKYSFIDRNLLAGKYTYRLKQIDYDGNFEFSDLVKIEILTPIEFSLSQNYPNPFNPSTTIKYQIPINGFVTLRVFNTIGEEVSTLVNEFKSAGNYEIHFDAEDLTSGIYFYRLKVDNFNSTRKMILLK